jgi:hypothetical protein
MSQADYVLANAPGITFRLDANDQLAAIVSINSGSSSPSTTYAYMFWADTSTGLLKQRNAANSAWITKGKIADADGNSKLRGPVAAGGTADAITAAAGTTALDEGIIIAVECGGANTLVNPTISFDALGAKTIVKGSNVALAVGDIPGANFVGLFRYDVSLDKVQLLNPATSSSISKYSSVRQAVISGPVTTAGLPSYLPASASGLTLTTQNITASAPLVVNAAGGYGSNGDINSIGFADSNFSFPALNNNVTWWGYAVVAANGTMTYAWTGLQPISQFGGTPSVTSGQITYNIQEGVAYLGNGSAAVKTNVVVLCQAITSGGNITSATPYAYSARYESAFTNTLPGTGTNQAFNHNIGDPDVRAMAEFKCLSAELGYSVGDTVQNPSITIASGSAAAMPITVSSLSCSFTTGATAAFNFVNKTTGASGVPTAASWAYRMVARRRY